MSQYPDPSQYPQPPGGYQDPRQAASPLPYQSWGVPSAPTRPAAITGMAWTGISLGILWGISAVFGVIGNGIMLANGGTNLFMPSLPKMNLFILKIGFVHALVSLPFIAVLIYGCTGALKLRPGALKTMMLWSVATIIYAAANTLFQIVWILPANNAMLQKLQPNNPALGIMSAIQTPVAIFSGMLYCVVPGLFLTLWSRPHVKAAFAPPSPAAPGLPPGYPPNQ